MAYVPPLRFDNFYKCINGLRYLGIGARVTRNIYKFPNTYFIVTKVTMGSNQERGKAWGVLVWRGIRKSKSQRIGATQKDEWFLVGTPDYSKLGGNEEEMAEGLQNVLADYGDERVEWTPEEKAIKLGK